MLTTGSNAPYAPYVHEGTGLYAVDGHGRKDVPWYFPVDGLNKDCGLPKRKIRGKEFFYTSGQHPTPFLKDAIEENKDNILHRFEGCLQNGDSN